MPWILSCCVSTLGGGGLTECTGGKDGSLCVTVQKRKHFPCGIGLEAVIHKRVVRHDMDTGSAVSIKPRLTFGKSLSAICPGRVDRGGCL